jgi:hypothetical protein
VVRFLPSWKAANPSNTKDGNAQKHVRTGHATGGEMLADILFWAGVVALMIYVFVSSSSWEGPARMLPQAIAIAGLVTALGFAVFSYIGKIPKLNTESSEPMRAVSFQVAWLVALVIGVKLIGMLPAIGLFIFLYMVIEGKTKPLTAVVILLPFLGGVWFLFHELLHVPWPQSLLGDVFGALRKFSGSLI